MRLLSYILKILGHLHRPRHYWKYVSPQRRSAGIIVLALLLTCIYGWWALTNEGRTRRHARNYLRNITGAHVSLEQARFRLFGPIELRGVRIDITDKRGLQPFMAAKTVLLRHRPWRVLFGGAVSPTEIICIEPSVWIEHNQADNSYNFQKLLAAREKKTAPGLEVLPRIIARKCRYNPVEIIDSISWPGDPTTWDITMIPQGSHYKLHIAESRTDNKPPVDVRAMLDVSDGAVSNLSVSGEIPGLARALPQRYRVWRKTYSINGRVHLKTQADDSETRKIMQVQFENVSMSLPVEQGGLGLEDVKGGLAFTLASEQSGESGCVELVKITGRIPQAQDAQFEMSGKFDGYEPTDPFEINFKITGAALPGGDEKSRLGQIFDFLQRWYKPVGEMDISGKIVRGENNSTFQYEIDVFPKDVSICFKKFAYRINNINGKITVKDGVVFARNLKGQRNGAVFSLDADAKLDSEGASKDYDITITAISALLTDELKNAMPELAQGVFEQINPSGKSSAKVMLHKRPQESISYKADIWADGELNICYGKFPYPLENIRGMIHLDGDNLWTDSADPPKAELDNGSKVTLTGKILDIESENIQAELFIKGSDVVLDDKLMGCVSKVTAGIDKQLEISGLARRVTASIVKTPGAATEYDISCSLESAKIVPGMFKYAIEDAAGDIRIKNDDVTIEKLSGRHNETAFSGSGKINLKAPVAIELNVSATNMSFDGDLYNAMNEKGKKIYDSFNPQGKMDIDLSLFKTREDKDIDYLLSMRPTFTQVSYAKFPYGFKNLSGAITAKPGLITIERLGGNEPPMSLLISGEIKTLAEKVAANLSVNCVKLPFDKNLIEALKGGFPQAADNMLPGGTCDVNLSKLSVEMRDGKGVNWSAVGKLRLDGVSYDIASGRKNITGSLAGNLLRTVKGDIGTDLEVNFDKITAGKIEMTNVGGKIVKKPDSNLVIFDELFAMAYGGKLAGRRTMVSLGDPAKYAFSVFYENVLFSELIGALETKERRMSDVKGTLFGQINLQGAWGDPKSWRGTGEMTISDAKIYDLPIPLGVVHLLMLSTVYDTAFNEGYLKYHIDGQKLVFDEIYLAGPAISLVGSGTLNIKTEQVELQFIQGPSGRIPRIRGLGEDLLEAVLREISQIRISGTLSKPIRKTVPLQSLDRIIKTLLTPDR